MMSSRIARQYDMYNTTFSQEDLNKMKCFLCNEYLSQLPVYIYPHQKGAVCGRCPILAEDQFICSAALETLAPYLYFPCRYNATGCTKTIALTDMKIHEDSCTYKQYYCPIVPLGSCHWQGTSTELILHYREQHPLYVLEAPTFELDLLNTYEVNYLFQQENDLFILNLSCDLTKNSTWLSVGYIGDKDVANQSVYQIELSNNNLDNQVVLPKKQIRNVLDATLDKAIAANIRTSDIRNLLGDSFLVTFSVLPKELSTESIEEKEELKAENADNRLVFELECPVCNWYMFSPIYQCVNGHSICNDCKPRLPCCPTCRGDMSNIRNFTLENLSSCIKLYCENKKFGCLELLSSSEYRNHVSDCNIRLVGCPSSYFLECVWKGNLKDTVQHVLLEHKEFVLEISDLISFSLEDSGPTKFYLIIAYDQIFILCFKYEDEHFYWCMQSVNKNQSNCFTYELDFWDNYEMSSRFYLRRECCEFLPHEVIFTDPSRYAKVPYNLISHFVFNGILTLKYQILETQKC